MAKTAAYMRAYRARKRFAKNGDFKPTAAQVAYEDSIRNGSIELGAYFDRQGNIVLQGSGDSQSVEFDPVDMNRNVLQRIWKGQEINFTHNHPENTIFSPDDIHSLDAAEMHSTRAVLPNGVSYTLTRVQPRTSNTWVYNPKTGEMEREFTAQKLGPAYEAEYSRFYDAKYTSIRDDRTLQYSEKQQRWAVLDQQTATHMSSWLRQNAMKYGYSFKKSTR